MAWNVARLLHDEGVPIALSSHGLPGIEDRLPMQAAHAMSGGLPFEATLEAVTIAPARMLGVERRVGSIEVGKDADLVLWNGQPFEPGSRVVGVDPGVQNQADKYAGTIDVAAEGVTAVRWWSLAELDATGERIIPSELAQLVRSLAP
jgi:predicted amidohydrolase YtcJ